MKKKLAGFTYIVFNAIPKDASQLAGIQSFSKPLKHNYKDLLILMDDIFVRHGNKEWHLYAQVLLVIGLCPTKPQQKRGLVGVKEKARLRIFL